MISNIKKVSDCKEKSRLLSNFISLSVLQVFTYALPLITLPYLVRVLGVEKFGLVMFAQSFIMFFSILIDYGFNLSATREVSIHRSEKGKLTEIYSSIMLIKLILIGASFIMLSFVIFGFERFSRDWGLYYLAFLWVIGQALFPVWYFQGLEEMRYVTIVNVTSKLVFTIAIFIFIRGEQNYILVPLLNGLGSITGGAYSMWIIKKHFSQEFKLQKATIILEYLRDSSQFFLSRISISVYTSANAFVLGIFTNNTMVGYYSVAEKLYLAMQSLYYPVVQALYPYVAKERNIKLFKRIFYSAVVLNVAGVVSLFFIVEYVFVLFFYQDMGVESIRVLQIFLVANLVVVPSMLMGYPFLAALGFAQYANMSIIYGSLMHLFILSLLVMVHCVNIYSIAVAIVITESVVFGQRLFWVKETGLWQRR